MEKKINNIVIETPDGMEAYLEGNIVKFKPIEKKLAYENIAKELFENKDVWRISGLIINKYNRTGCWNYLTNCISEKQAKKLLAINQLMNVAKYLNGNWQPNWNNGNESKYYIRIRDNIIEITDANFNCSDIVYFKTYVFTQQAIDILGEETIKLALCTDW
nr:MAG TPA: hypothetical protein [Crassvirales sp.]